jgi:hypothetical protein
VFSESASWKEGKSVPFAAVKWPYIRRGAFQFEFTIPLTLEALTFCKVAKSTPVEEV